MLDATIDKLNQFDGISIDRLEYGRPVEEEFGTLKILGDAPPPESLMSFYKAMNGVTLLWGGIVEGSEVAGSLNIHPMLQSSIRAPFDEEGEPLEGVLWTDDTPEPELSSLKEMTIFESVSGRDDFITYKSSEDGKVAYFVSDWEIEQLPMQFEALIDALVKYGGADRAREHLLHDDWQQRLDSDQLLQKMFG